MNFNDMELPERPRVLPEMENKEHDAMLQLLATMNQNMATTNQMMAFMLARLDRLENKLK